MPRTTSAHGSGVLKKLLRSTLLVVPLILGSCGSETTNGGLCQRCGVNWGDCQESSTVTGDHRPSVCGDQDPCTVELACATVVDTRVNRCYPLDANGDVDNFYRCDGERPAP